MKMSTTVTAVAGAAVGLVVGLGAYQAIAGPPSTPVSGSSSSADGASYGADGFAPCEPPSRLVDGACQTDIERKVVLYDAPGAGVPAVAPVAGAAAPRREGDDNEEYGEEDEHDDGSHEVGDDDSYEVEDE